MPFKESPLSAWVRHRDWRLLLVLWVFLSSSLAATGQCCCGNPAICGRPGGGNVCNLQTCQCQPPSSPILVDTTGGGFHLTSAEEGVTFDIQGDGHPVNIAWTAADSGNAFLALDRNHNGRIDSGKELFGNVTAQPKSDRPNGFLALAEFDKPENGFNGDGIIDSRDAVFSHLLLWIDEDHDGISQPEELHKLPELGVYSLGLHYKEEWLRDQFGNLFHYKSAVNPDLRDGRSKDGRWDYDVFFSTIGSAAEAFIVGPRLERPVETARHFRSQQTE